VLIDNPPYPNAAALLPNASPSLVGANNIIVTDNPYLMQYNFSIQQQFAGSWVMNLGYIGSRGVHLTSVRDGNSAYPIIQADGRKFFPANGVRRNPNFAEISNYQTDADSRYHGLVVGLSQRFNNGLQLQVSYTYSKLLDNSSAHYAPEASGAGSRTSGDPDNLRPDWGLSSQHVGQNFVANSTYVLPFGNGLGGWKGQVISGWQLNGIITMSAGVPRNVQLSFDRTRTLGNGFTPRPDLVPGASTSPTEGMSAGCPGLTGADRPLKLGTPDLWMDPCAFALQDAGYLGNLGRNTVIGPGLLATDISVAKNFRLPWEGTALQFRSEVFNLINRANFGAPLSNVFSNATIQAGNTRPNVRSDFGLIRDTRTTNRQIQMALKLTF
jgi:hypothetical protein